MDTSMDKEMIEERIYQLEKAISTQQYSFSKLLLMGGEWYGLKKVLGDENESAWGMLWRCGIAYDSAVNSMNRFCPPHGERKCIRCTPPTY